jgi:hypothetical protein
MDHYDLLARPEWRAASILIISPYVEREFFERIVRDLRPARLTVVIDDGCRPNDIAMIQGLARKKLEVTVVLGSAPGLVHAKIFHVEWLTTGGSRAHTLVYGSGNATRQAFASDFNAELMCKVRLTAAKHAPILNWMKKVRRVASDPDKDNSLISPVRNARLADGVEIRLPGILIKEAVTKASNLDLWLQRGRLLSKFQADASFLRIHVPLRQALPAGDLMQKVKRIGFETPMLEKLSIPYVQTVGDAHDGDAMAGNWLGHFFIWTQLGYWCSDACFRTESSRFKRKGHEQRLENLRLLKELKSSDQRQQALLRYLTRIDQLWTILGDQASVYLDARHGEINESAYGVLFEKRLERDLSLVDDTEFRDRYVNGCEVIDVPRFRTDAIGWRSFIDSFMRQIHVEALKAKSQSRVYNAIKNALSDQDDDPKKLRNLLRSNWNECIEGDYGEEITVGEYIDGYHEQY